MRKSVIFLCHFALFCGLIVLYGGQVWASAKSEEMSAHVRNKDLIMFRSLIFDPMDRLPLEADFSISSWRDTVQGMMLHVVQFNDTPSAADRNMLTGLGAEFLYYIPNNAYLVRFDGRHALKVQEASNVRSVFRLPKWSKIAPELSRESTDIVRLELIAVPGSSARGIFGYISKRYPDVVVTTWDYHHVRGRVVCEVPNNALSTFLDEISGLEDVLSIMPSIPKQLLNDESIWVGQSYDTTNTTNYALSATIWNHGILGTDQIVCVNDSGLDSDMCYFRYDADSSSVATVQELTPPDIGTVEYGKKIIAYYVEPGAEEWDTSSASYHGTHTSGSVAGDNFATLSTPSTHGHDTGDGMAPNAQMIMQDVGNSGGSLSGLTGDLNDMFQQAYDAGARIHSDSWGTTESAYDATALDMDEFMFRHEDFLFVVAMGNSGNSPGDGSIGSPATAKNIVSVGATTNGGSSSQADNMTTYSRGPVDDGRLKPDVVSPGYSVVSASGTTSNTDANCSSKTLSGTSMATPTTSGYITLLRQYFMDGFYPTGAADAADALIPTGALMKACMVNGAMPLGGTDPLSGSSVTPIPSMDQGWGRSHLDNVLYFSGDTRRLRVWDIWNMNGLQTGEQQEYHVDVTSSSLPLEVHLVWTDPESTTLAATNLVNNLDLEVVNPAGTTTYLGNVFSGGVSTTGGSADVLNPIEGVLLNSPATGTWTIRVKATSVPGIGSAPYSERQGYALVATFADCSSTLSTPTGLNATNNGSTGIDLSWNSVSGATGYLVYRALGSSPLEEEYSLVDTTTATTYSDTFVQGGYTYSYKIRATDDCSESDASSADTATYTGNCQLYPDFDGLLSVINDTSSPICDLVLNWDAGASNCPLGPDLTYNIYSDTDPYFTPGLTNLLVSGVTGTSYTDYSVFSHTTYYYIVRAEDSTTLNSGPNNGGNEDTNVIKLSGTPWSETTTAGTWADDGGDTNAKLMLEGEWQITNQENNTTGGSLSYHNAKDGMNHSAGQCAAATTPELLLQAGSPTLSYWVNYNLENSYDGVVTEISTDSGLTWTTLTPNEGYPGDFSLTDNPPINACEYTTSQDCYSGPSGNAGLTGWTQYTHSLSAYAGLTVQIRWNFSSDPGTEFIGFYLDDIEITLASVNDDCATSAGQVKLDRILYNCSGDTININVGDNDLNGNGSQTVTIASNVSEPAGETVVLTETPPNTGSFVGSIQTTSDPAPSTGLLSVADGETITVTYIDADDGQGGYNVTKTDTAQTDCVLPIISNIAVSNITTVSATINWDTNELADSIVYYGTTPPTWSTVAEAALVTEHGLDLTGLTPCTLYYFWVESADAAENVVYDDAGGAYYSFTTLMDMALFFDDMESGPSNWTAASPWAISDEDYYSASHAWSDSPGGSYANSIDISLTSIAFDLSGTTEASLSFWQIYDLESGWDYGYVEISTNGSTWSQLAVFNGTQSTWTEASYDLTAYVGNPSVQIRFRLDTDGSQVYDGWHIDDVHIGYAAPCVPMAEYDSHIFTDDCPTGGVGDGDGILDAGENIVFQIDIANIGIGDLTGVWAELSSSTTGVTVTDAQADYNNILEGTSGTSLSPHFMVHLAETIACGTELDFSLTIHTNEGDFSGGLFSETAGLVIPGDFTLVDEDFESSWGTYGDNPPAGWTIEDYGDESTPTWNANDWYRYSKGGAYSYIARVYYSPLENQDEWLITPAFTIPAGAISVNLEYDHYFRVYNTSEYGYVDFRSTQNPTWTNLATYSTTTSDMAHVTISLLAYAGNTNCQVRFRYESYNGWNWDLDNVLVSGVQDGECNMTVCTGGCSMTVDVTPNGTTTVCTGNAIMFTATPTGGTSPYSYQWTEDGSDIGGATNATLTRNYATAQSHTYNCKVSDAGSCVDITDGTASTGTWELTPGAPVISSVADLNACALTGVSITFTAGSGAASHNLWVDGSQAVTGITSPYTYVPSDTSSHSYVVRAINGGCYADSNAMAGTDINDGVTTVPVITSIVDNDPLVQDGIFIYYTAGSPATSHNLYRDSSLVVTGYVSGILHNPGDTNSHSYVVRAINGACHADSTAVAATDEETIVPPEITPIDWSGSETMSWAEEATATNGYALYRGVQANLASLLTSATDFCIRWTGSSSSDTSATGLTETATVGDCYYYLVVGVNGAGQGSAGYATAGERQVNDTGACP